MRWGNDMRMGSGGFGRSKVAAVAATSALVLAVTTAGPSQAQELPGVGNGAAKATAVLVKAAPGVGALELGITTGVAVSETTNAFSQSQAQAADLGLIGTTLTSEGCGDAAFSQSDLPQPLRVDNRQGDVSESRDELAFDGTLVGGGRLDAAATSTPSARSTATGLGLELDPLISLSGGRSIAETTVFPGEGRQAHAVVETSLEIAGLVKLDGLRWDALHRTGNERVVEGAFQIGSAEIGDIPYPGEDLGPVEDAVNTALEFTGITIDFPEVREFSEPTDLIRVTPLRIILNDSPLGGTILGPILNLTREQREQMFDELASAICESAGVLLVGDIAVSVVSGTGFLVIEIGGAEAISGEFEVGDAIGLPPAPQPVAPAPGGTPAPSGAGAGGADGGTGVVAEVPGNEQAADVVTGAPVADVGPLERVCESIHPFDWPSCSQGAAPLAGLIGLLGTGAMFGLDWRRQRARAGDQLPDDAIGASA